MLSLRAGRIFDAVAAAAAVTGCSMPNSSNPTLTISSAQVAGQEARFDLLVENPSERNLILTGIDYSVVLGPLPVAAGLWSGREALPSQGSVNISLVAPFDSPPIDPGASEIELSGEMSFEDETSGGNMALERASFSESARVDR